MSIIVVVSDGQRCVMACDSGAVCNGSVFVQAEPKMHRVHDMIFGWSGTNAAADFLRYHFEAGELRPAPLDLWLATEFVPDFHSWLKERDLFEKNRDNVEWPCRLVVARGAEFVELDGSGHIIKVAGAWHAIGSGAEVARGAIFGTRTQYNLLGVKESDGVEEMARLAVVAACELNDGCRGPVHVMWTEGAKP